MKDGNFTLSTNIGDQAPLRSIRGFNNWVLDFADSGIPRPEFLKEFSGMLLRLSGCDSIRLVFCKDGRCYRSGLSRKSLQSFRYEESSEGDPTPDGFIWSAGSSDALEELCRTIISGKYDESATWFTRNGTFWSGNVGELPIRDLVSDSSSGNLGIGISSATRSVVLLAIESKANRIGLLEMESEKQGLFDASTAESYETVAQSLGISLVQRRLQEEVRERVKELTCLYGIAKLAAQPEISLEDVLLQAVELLPPGWLYPDICCARFVLDGQTYAAKGYRKPIQAMRSTIKVDGAARGFVEVGYVWDKPSLDEGPFLTEERRLIDAIAGEVSVIVEQKQAESERTKLRQQLRHADRLATIGQLGAGLAHELNEPLAGILGFAQLAAKDESITGQTRQDIDKIVAAALHAREVIAKLLVFARETSVETTKVDLNQVISEGLYFLQSRCTRAGIVLSRVLHPGLPEIAANRSQLLQVLTNLIVNAIQAMPEGGSLTISTAHEGDRVLLKVRDTGIGMTEETLERIFEPFFTTKDVDEGTGLGLSVVHGIVTSHGGAIDVESEPGQGTLFVISFPTGEDKEDRRE